MIGWDPDGEPDGPGSPDDRYLSHPATWTSLSGVPGMVETMKSPGKDASPEERAAYNAYMLDYMNRRHAKHRAMGHERLGGVCVECGTTEGLDFHHIDPATKAFTIASHLGQSWKRLVVEIDKCELLCRDCHTDHHRSTAPCGTMRRYWRGCRCPECKAAMRAYNQTRRVVRRRLAA